MTASDHKSISKKPPNFTNIGKREVALRGYSLGGLEEHLGKHIVTPSKFAGDVWCDPACAARHFCTKATQDNCKKMRKRFGKVTALFLSRRNRLVLKQYGLHGAITKVKLFDPTSTEDIKFAKAQLETARDKGELREDQLRQMERLIGIQGEPDEGQPSGDQVDVQANS